MTQQHEPKWWHGPFLIALGALLHVTKPEPDPEGPQLAVVELGLLVLSVGLSLLAGQLLKKKNKSPIEDDKPTTLSTRGSFTNWWIGVRRLGPVFCWAGDRSITKEEVGGGKGGDGPEQDVFYEAGWHALGVGPGFCLYQIIQGGKVIFNGPITAESHPSGSTVDLGKEGAFVIYWGEQDQPINNFLGSGGRVSISSRWPFMCYIVWNKKRLGTSPNWPILDYVMERRPQVSETYLTGSSSWYNAGITLDGPTIAITDFVSSATPTTGYLEVEGNQSSVFKPKTSVEITGNGLPNGTYEVLKTELVQTQVSIYFYTTQTRVFLTTGTLGADDQGSMQTYSADDTNGANIAHVAVDMLFAQSPEGLSLDPNGPEPWDINSFDDWGIEYEADGWRASLFGSEGETAQALLGAMLQDHGAMLPINTQTGLLEIKRIREPSGTIANIGDDIFADNLSEREVFLAEKPVDKLVFEFKDRALQFATATIAIDDDGQAFFLEHQRARKVPISSTVQFATAAKIAELRSPEELSDKSEFTLNCSREARELMPGDPIVVSGFAEVLRVLTVDMDPLSERVNIRVVPDFYGVPKTDFENETGGGQPTVEDPANDEQFTFIEVPEQLSPTDRTILVPRIRANDQIINTTIHLSRDNTTYVLWGTESFVQTGGTLDDPLPDDGPTWVPTGPEFTERGPDNATLSQDLSADPVNFGLGRQLALIVSTAGKEICFLTRSVVVSGTTRRLDGLLRARYDSRKLDHPAGAEVYIFNPSSITPIGDPLLEPAEDLFVKSQPATSGGQVLLAGVSPVGEQLIGKPTIPIQVDQVTVTAPRKNVASYLTGEDVTVRAMVSSAASVNTGAGFQNAGTVIAAPTLKGTVNFELLTLGDVVQDTKSGASIEQTWTNAEIVAALGSETSFKIRVTHVVDSQTSLPAEVTITKL